MIAISVYLICWAKALFVRIFGTPLIKRPLTLKKAMISVHRRHFRKQWHLLLLVLVLRLWPGYFSFGRFLFSGGPNCLSWFLTLWNTYVSCAFMWGLPVFKAGCNKSKCRKIDLCKLDKMLLLWVTSLVDSCRVSPQ